MYSYLQELDNFFQMIVNENVSYAGDVNINSLIENLITDKYLLLLQIHGFSFYNEQSYKNASGIYIDPYGC